MFSRLQRRAVARSPGDLDFRPERQWTTRARVRLPIEYTHSSAAGARGRSRWTLSGYRPVRIESGLAAAVIPFNPNLFGAIKAINPFIGDYIGFVADATQAYVVWTDNRDINPTANAQEDTDATTDPPALINARSRDSNIYFQKILK